MAKKRPTDKKLAADEHVPIPEHLRPRPALHYELDKKPECRVLWVLRSLTPGLNYFTKKYSRRWLRADSIAGLAVAAYLIPQVMAYSAIVNVPPVASLWAALAAIVAYVVLPPPPRERPRPTSGPIRRPNLSRWRVCTRWSASSAAIRSARPGRVQPWRSPVARAASSTPSSPGCASSPF